MSDYIPFEIQTEIIKFLPIKSLIQFRSVSKQWNSLITSSEFIADYHNHHTEPPEHIFVSYFDKQSYKQKHVSFVDNDDATFPIQTFSPTLPESVSIKLLDKLAVIRSSNGLLCLFSRISKTVVIWDPTIRKSVDIDLHFENDKLYNSVIGFGVSPHTLDPKIVKFQFSYIDYLELFYRRLYIPWKVEVFTLSSGVWISPLCDNLPRESIQLTQYVVDINGFLYFLAYEWIVSDEDVLQSYLIISFDLKTEEFTEIPIPHSLAYTYRDDLVLSKFRESIVVFVFKFSCGKDLKVDVWIMENDNQRSFSKLLTVDPHNVSIADVFGFRKSGELLIEARTGGQDHTGLFVYEPNSKQLSYIGISGKSLSFIGGSYVETLLLLNH